MRALTTPGLSIATFLVVGVYQSGHVLSTLGCAHRDGVCGGLSRDLVHLGSLDVAVIVVLAAAGFATIAHSLVRAGKRFVWVGLVDVVTGAILLSGGPRVRVRLSGTPAPAA